MSLVDRLPFRRKAGPPPEPEPPPPLPPGGGAVVDPGELREERLTLASELAELTWDLGGLAYEMAIRDHFRLDVLVRQAARVQEVDAELGEVERLLRMEEGGAAGSCPSCGALHARGAVFCSQCGRNLIPTSSKVSPRPASADDELLDDEPQTEPLDALDPAALR